MMIPKIKTLLGNYGKNQVTVNVYFYDLNEKQQEAVFAPDGPVLVIAGAGSGKTTVMIEKIIRLIKDGANVGEILAVTFTKKAASQMKEKLCKALIEEMTRLRLQKAQLLGYEDYASYVLENNMAKNVVPEAKDALNRFKMEAANEVGVNLNGNLSAVKCGFEGGVVVSCVCEETKLLELTVQCSGHGVFELAVCIEAIFKGALSQQTRSAYQRKNSTVAGV